MINVLPRIGAKKEIGITKEIKTHKYEDIGALGTSKTLLSSNFFSSF